MRDLILPVSGARRAYGLTFHGLAGVAELPVDTAGGAGIRIGQTDDAPPAVLPLGADAGVLRLADGRHLAMTREPATAMFFGPWLSPDLMAHPYLGPVASTFARWAGREVFHAGGVVIDGLAWVVLGERTAGKSTLLAALAGRGVPVVSDDILVTDGRLGYPGPRCIDLREALPGQPLAGTTARLGTRLRVPLPALTTPVRLGGWLFLRWGPAALVPVRAEVVLARLARLRTWGWLASDPRTMLALGTLPGWDVIRPRDWADLPGTVDRLLATLARQSAA